MNVNTCSKTLPENLRMSISRAAAAVLLIMALFTVPMNFDDGIHEFMEIFGFFLLIVAGLGRIWCSIYIAGLKDKKLCTEGPYSISRNPLYFFSFIGTLGIFFALQNLPLVVISAILFLGYYYFVITSEEKRLTDIFGVSYLEYKESTPRFFPDFHKYHSPESHRMTATKTIERGLREVFWFFAAIAIIELVEEFHQHDIMVLAQLPF